MTNIMPPQLPSDISLAQHLLAMTLGVAQTQVLCVAAQLGLAVGTPLCDADGR
jgi:hypothetical protein